jgi:prepilin-type N-terminal cleavage/methylation domain-containing protein
MEKSIKIAGVSLIEVMISMVLISLLLMAVASVFPRMSSHRKAVQESDIAKDIATETLEYLQLYSAVPNQGCSNGGGFPLSTSLPTGDPYKERWIGAAKYEISWDVSCTGNPGYYPVTVTVGWRKQGKPHTITVTGTVQ